MEKQRRKRVEGDEEERKMLIEKHSEKFNAVLKKREHINEEYEKNLKRKEDIYNQRMQILTSNRKRATAQDMDMINSR